MKFFGEFITAKTKPGIALQILILLVFTVLVVFMIANSFLAKNWDFQVYYAAAKHLVNLEHSYDLARDGMWPHKYPPWINPFLLPFGYLEWSLSNTVWRLIQTFSAFYAIYWCTQRVENKFAPIAGTVVCYGIFMMIILAGQIQLVLLAIALASFSVIQKKPHTAFFGLFFSLSAKFFTLFAFLGLPKGSLKWSSFFIAMLLGFILSLSTLAAYQYDALEAFRTFVEVTTSKGQNVIGARDGFPFFFIFLLGLDRYNPSHELISFLLSGVFCLVFFLKLKPKLTNPNHLFAVAIAIGAATSPLAFGYTFSWSFPLVAFVVEKVFLKEQTTVGIKILTILSFFLLVVYSSGNVTAWGFKPPVFGARSIGVLILSWLLATNLNSKKNIAAN